MTLGGLVAAGFNDGDDAGVVCSRRASGKADQTGSTHQVEQPTCACCHLSCHLAHLECDCSPGRCVYTGTNSCSNGLHTCVVTWSDMTPADQIERLKRAGRQAVHDSDTPYCRTVCLLHGSLLCACSPSAWRMVFRQSVAELQAQAEALRPRLPAPGGAGLCNPALAGQAEAVGVQACHNPSLTLLRSRQS